MYPVLIALTIGAAIAIERYIKLTKVMRANKRVWYKVQPLLRSGEFEMAHGMVKNDKTEISSILRTGLKHQDEVQDRDDIERVTNLNMIEIVPKLEKRTHYVALFANISTLLGLLGTIVGLIEAFTAVASADPADKASFLSASISVAMNTTAFGLMSAIILLISYTILRSKTLKIINSLEIVSVKTMNIINEFSQNKTFGHNN